MGAVNSEGDTPLDIAEEEAMEELLQNEVNRQGNSKGLPRNYIVHERYQTLKLEMLLFHVVSFLASGKKINGTGVK